MDKIIIDNIINLYNRLTYDDTREIKRQLIKLYHIDLSNKNKINIFIVNASDKNYLLECLKQQQIKFGVSNTKIFGLLFQNGTLLNPKLVKLYHNHDTCLKNTCILCGILDTCANKKIMDPPLFKTNLIDFCRKCLNGGIIKIISKNNICYICQTSDCAHILNKSILMDTDCLSINELYRFYVNKKIIRSLILDGETDLFDFSQNNCSSVIEPLINKLTISIFLKIFNQFSPKDKEKIIKKTVGSIYFIDSRYLVRITSKKMLVDQILNLRDTITTNGIIMIDCAALTHKELYKLFKNSNCFKKIQNDNTFVHKHFDDNY